MIYPTDLTTSDWVDCLAGQSREDQITILATYHRRIEHAAKTDALTNLAAVVSEDAVATPIGGAAAAPAVDKAPVSAEAAVAAARDAALASLTPPKDYDPSV